MALAPIQPQDEVDENGNPVTPATPGSAPVMPTPPAAPAADVPAMPTPPVAPVAAIPPVGAPAATPAPASDGSVLNTALAKVYGQMGQDVTDPAVQAQLAKTAATMRQINPGVSDADLVTKIQTNLPALITTIQAKPEGNAVNATMLQDLATKQNAQLDKDSQNYAVRQGLTPLRDAFPRSITGATDASNAEWEKGAFMPSTVMGTQLTNLQNARTADQAAVGKNSENISLDQKAQQEKLATQLQLIMQADKVLSMDPTSVVSKMTVSNGAAALKAAGAPDSVVQSLNGLPASQALTIMGNYKESLGAGQAQANLSKALADIREIGARAAASIALAKESAARTEGIKSDNVVKAIDAKVATKATSDYLTPGGDKSGAGLGGAPAPMFNKYATGDQQSRVAANTEALKTTTATAPDRAALRGQLDELVTLLQPNGAQVPTGALNKWTGLPADLSTRLQIINKTVSGIQAKQQAGGGGTTAAGASSIQGATPDITKNRATLLNWAQRQLAQVDASDILQSHLQSNSTHNSLVNADPAWVAKNTRSYGNPVTGEVRTLPPEEPRTTDKDMLGMKTATGTPQWVPIIGGQ